MKTGTKRKIVLVLLAIAFLFASCDEEKKVSTDNENDARPEATVAVGVASGTAFQGLDEVRDPETGAVIEDSVTYISMENNQEIVLRVTMAQSTEIYQRILLRTDAPTIFRLGTQSPANSDAVTLQPGRTTDVYIRSFYNGEDEPRLQTDTLRVVGVSSENGETTLRKFRIGSYKRVDLNLRVLLAPGVNAPELRSMGADNLKRNMNMIWNDAIFNVESLIMEDAVFPYDINGNGFMDYPTNLEAAEFYALQEYFKSIKEDGDVIAVVPTIEATYPVVEKIDQKTFKVDTYIKLEAGATMRFAPASKIHDATAVQMVTIHSYDATNKVVVFEEDVLDFSSSEDYVLYREHYVLQGLSQANDSASQIMNLNLPTPVIGGNSLYVRPSIPGWAILSHETSHLYGLLDVAARDNLMVCNSSFWGTSIPRLRGRPIPIAETGTGECSLITGASPQAQWDALIREPKWVE